MKVKELPLICRPYYIRASIKKAKARENLKLIKTLKKLEETLRHTKECACGEKILKKFKKCEYCHLNTPQLIKTRQQNREYYKVMYGYYIV